MYFILIQFIFKVLILKQTFYKLKFRFSFSSHKLGTNRILFFAFFVYMFEMKILLIVSRNMSEYFLLFS